MPARLPSFWLKVILAVGVVALADWTLFEAKGIGVNVAVVLTATTAALAITRPAVWRDRLGRWALAAAAMLAVLPAERPSLVGVLLWVLSIAVATLAPRAARGDDGWCWGQRLVVAGVKAFFMWVKDLRILLESRARRRTLKITAVLLAAALPVIGGLIFLELFATANPIIARWQSSFELPALDAGRIMFWLVIAFPLATILRPRSQRRLLSTAVIEGDLNLPGMSGASITAALAVFNAVFAVQNGLDIAYLWSGAGLPQGMSFADYAHRGAYPLIATALLAGLFVLVFLRPGSATAARPAVRWLVTVWVLQNLFLVASTILRMADYVDAYSLTRMRIAALIWMGLVAVGLVLILWRVLRARSSSWLINANVALLGVVLAGCSLVDFSAITAGWNVRHAREVGGKGVALDLCYMRSLKGGAVVPLAHLETFALPPGLRERVVNVRGELASDMVRDHSGWRAWRWRDARRLERLAELGRPALRLGGRSFNDFNGEGEPPGVRSGCDGSLIPPPTNPPLTPSPNPRT
jgi:hypothetical protein